MKNNNFRIALKENVPHVVHSTFHNVDKTNLLLLKLGLFPIPKNVQASISDDNKYLNIKLKDTSTEQHLLFQFPLEEKDFSFLKNRSDYLDLINRYNLYINDYVEEIKKYAMMERSFLQEKYPGLVFNIKIRIKSYDSYIDKLNENIVKGKSPYINDIIAERIIISDYNGSKDEDILIQMCDEVAKSLYDLRIKTNFRMKKDINYNQSNSDKKYISRDYIENPKDNGYQSIHILMEHKNNKDFKYETQIRTFDMENRSKTSGEISHHKYKPRILNDLSTNRVTIYSEISCFSDASGNPIIIDIPLDNRFYHFYNSEKIDHSNPDSKKTIITYKKFRSEQYQLENLLGIPFKEIRKKLRILNSKNKEKNEKVR